MPRQELGQVLTALAGSLEGWEVLLWMTGSNGFLDGGRPIDLLGTDLDAVLQAARNQAMASED